MYVDSPFVISVTDFPIPWKSLSIAILFDFHRSIAIIASFVSQGWNHLRLCLLECLIDANMALHGIKKHRLKRAQLRFPLPWCINNTNDSASSPRWLWSGDRLLYYSTNQWEKGCPKSICIPIQSFQWAHGHTAGGNITGSLAECCWILTCRPNIQEARDIHFRGHFESLSLSDFQSQSCQDAGNISVTQTKN